MDDGRNWQNCQGAHKRRSGWWRQKMCGECKNGMPEMGWMIKLGTRGGLVEFGIVEASGLRRISLGWHD